MKNRKYHLYLTNEEYIHIINCLVTKKNKLIEQGKFTDGVDELLIKLSKAKRKKMKVVYN